MKIIIGGDYSTYKTRDEMPATEAFSRELLRELRPHLESADIRICNLENVLVDASYEAPIQKAGPNLRGDPSEVGFLKAGGFDCVTLANNHLGDHGEAPILETMRLLDREGIAYIGGGRNLKEAYRAWYAEADGIRIAFLSVCENEFGGATDTKAGSAVYRQKYLRDAIVREKAKADFVILIFHGGQEYNPIPSPSAIDRYRLFVDFGCDAVVAMHTHCIEGYEYYEGKPIVYSLGNLYFPSFLSGAGDAWNYGYLAELTVERGKTVTVTPIPYRVTDGNRRIEVFRGEEKDAMLAYIRRISDIIADPKEVSRLYDGWCTDAGVRYLKQLTGYAEELFDPNADPAVRTIVTKHRGCLTCESHNAMLTRLSELLYEGRFEEAKPALIDLQMLQKMPV